ncbi:hypothetical protein L1080_004380 [Rhodococcus sp. MSC1_016]|jgi:hypothetical protein|uniref:hypothetical protein n=1 Tax=Rhodococcus sp. MSC1_016 TaxID=2909266 RepID=UPI002030D42F|nr:hypothetical protein [Rhodococcus sp. MSC1_016]
MSRPNVRLNRAGVGRLLKSEGYAAAINGLAHEIADAAGDDAQVAEYTTDRKAASVSVPAYQQASDGNLTRAAAAVGLEVRNR